MKRYTKLTILIFCVMALASSILLHVYAANAEPQPTPETENAVSVTGAVKSPGIYKYGDGLTLSQAITYAGGFTQDANQSSISIISNEADQREVLHTDYKSDTGLLPGDTVFVSAASTGNFNYNSASSGYGEATGQYAASSEEYGASTGTATPAGDGINYALMLEDTDIMCKIIDKTLEKKWPRKYEPSTLFRQSIGCQSVYLEGYGVVFMTNINFPVAKRETPQEIEVDTDDLWQQTRSELRGVKIDKKITVYTGAEDFDSKRVSDLKEKLLIVIGKYGSRIRQLDDRENVVIVVRGAAENSPMLPAVGYGAWKPDPETKVMQLKRLSEEMKKQNEKLKKQAEEAKQRVKALKAQREALQESDTGELPQIAKLEQEIEEAEKQIQNLAEKEIAKKEIMVAESIGDDVVYEAKEPSAVSMEIRNLGGSVVRKIEARDKKAGKLTLGWDGKNDAGKKVKSGIYTYQIKADDDTRTGKIIITDKSGSDSEDSLDDFNISYRGSKIIVNKDKNRNIHIVESSPKENAEVWMRFDGPEHAEQGALAQYFTQSAAQQKSNNTGRTALIIKASKKEIEAYEDNSIDFDEFAKRAKIIQY